ncbi:Sec-independent protein translocase TatB [Arthrobacter sp. SRS-W-1-2016]|uniref:sec-independent translocase n=1 Tax=Arthrobacter TaxID=1663 RepID=UPI0009911EE4|nr:MULTISPECIES: sec-independent translocase [Arthrobacter]MDQ0213026.1 sec-independent protein translocase protein TatB [Arthrobacter bambusae]MDQ0237332.1 sec-independent protein translocase protein TatB [Arthrobacter bambusae]OOP59690.1 Sec-independent protein translocase TatB [Arthrobacter sp. SRS-W-1-2016]
MIDISVEKIALLLIIAVLVLGPTKLPEYARKLGRLIRELRRMASGAQEKLRQELGPEFEDIDWRKMDPRQYDPRRIIREALLEDEPLPEPSVPAQMQHPVQPPARPVMRLAAGQKAPFDDEST